MRLLKSFVSAGIHLVSGFFRACNMRACRFHPSCSVYALQALERFSLSRGLMLATHRLLRCHPFSAGGFDPLPPQS